MDSLQGQDLSGDLNADLRSPPHGESEDEPHEWEWPLHPLIEKVLSILDRQADEALRRWKIATNLCDFIQWKYLRPETQRDFVRIYFALIREPGYVNREIQRIVMCASLPVNERLLARKVAVSAGWFVWSNLYLEPLA